MRGGSGGDVRARKGADHDPQYLPVTMRTTIRIQSADHDPHDGSG